MKSLATADSVSTALIPFSEIEKIATAIAKSQLFGVKDPTQAIALCLIAHAEGLHPAIAARDYSVIQGRPAKTSEAIQRTFLSAGGKIEWHTLTDELADATFSHPAGGTFRCSWDLDRARQAGLSNKENWKKYPRAMLRARCISEGCRTVFPGATSGMYTPEEVRDMAPEREVSGEVVEMHRNEPEKASPPEPRIGKESDEHLNLQVRIAELGLSIKGVEEWCARHLKVWNLPDLTATQYRDLLTRLPGFAVQKLQRQIPQMTAADLEALIKSPPAWLKPLTECAAVLEAADRRLVELQTPAPPESPEPADSTAGDPTYGGDFQEQIAG